MGCYMSYTVRYDDFFSLSKKYITSQTIGFTVKEKQKAYGKTTKKNKK
jgi:hypothetical protein